MKYYRDAAGVLIVYDVTNRETFDRVCRWVDEIKRYCDDTVAIVLVGNKDDVAPGDDSKVVSTEEAQAYARQMSLPFFESSAKDNKNVDVVFQTVTRMALQHQLEVRRKAQLSQRNDLTRGASGSQPIRLQGSKSKKKKKDKKHGDSCCQ